MPSSTARVHRGVLLTVLYVGVTFAHAQELRSIESVNQSYLTCVQSAFEQRRRDSGVCHKRPNKRFSTVSQRKMPSTRLPRHQHPEILKLPLWSVLQSNN